MATMYRTKRGVIKAIQAQHDGKLLQDAKVKTTVKVTVTDFHEGDWILEFKDGLKMAMHPELFARFFEEATDEPPQVEEKLDIWNARK